MEKNNVKGLGKNMVLCVIYLQFL